MSEYNTFTIAAHQAAINFASFLYMVPMSISMALTILVGFEAGAKRYKDARQYSYIGLQLAIAMAALCALFFLITFSDQVAAIYTKEPAVLALTKHFFIVRRLLPVIRRAGRPYPGSAARLQGCKCYPVRRPGLLLGHRAADRLLAGPLLIARRLRLLDRPHHRSSLRRSRTFHAPAPCAAASEVKHGHSSPKEAAVSITFGLISGVTFGDTSGVTFGDTSGTTFGDTSGATLGLISGVTFGDTSGSSFGIVNTSICITIINPEPECSNIPISAQPTQDENEAKFEIRGCLMKATILPPIGSNHPPHSAAMPLSFPVSLSSHREP